MKIYDRLYDVASENFGIITASQAKDLGVAHNDLSRLTSNGQLIRLGHGVYRVYHHTPQEHDIYAEQVALVGKDAYLYGESVLALHDLCPTDPTWMYIATPRRVRRRLPENIVVIKRQNSEDITSYEGIPSQKVASAILSCRHRIDGRRLLEATSEAFQKGLLRRKDKEHLDFVLEKHVEKA